MGPFSQSLIRKLFFDNKEHKPAHEETATELLERLEREYGEIKASDKQDEK